MDQLTAPQLAAVLRFYDAYQEHSGQHIIWPLQEAIARMGLPPLEDYELQSAMQSVHISGWENLQFAQIAAFFVALVAQHKRPQAQSPEPNESGMLEAFVALGGCPDGSGEVNTQVMPEPPPSSGQRREALVVVVGAGKRL